MADRVHPHDPSLSPPRESAEFKATPLSSPDYRDDSVKSAASPLNHQFPTKPIPPPGTYVIQIPKDQVYRVPPPENATRYAQLSRLKANRRSPCCRFVCWFLALLAALLLLSGITAAVLYLVFRPEAPNYSVQSISIKNLNFTSSAPVSPEIDVTVRADNPNDRIQIYYQSGSSVNVYYNDVRLCNGALPVFKQGTNNVTEIVMALTGSGIELTTDARKALSDEQSKGAVPLRLDVRAPVKLKIGSVKTWRITVKVNCNLEVDKLTANAKLVTNQCDYGVDVW